MSVPVRADTVSYTHLRLRRIDRKILLLEQVEEFLACQVEAHFFQGREGEDVYKRQMTARVPALLLFAASIRCTMSWSVPIFAQNSAKSREKWRVSWPMTSRGFLPGSVASTCRLLERLVGHRDRPGDAVPGPLVPGFGVDVGVAVLL